MKKNLKLKILLSITGYMLLQTQVIADPVVDAIYKLDADVIASLNGPTDTSITNKIQGLKIHVNKLFDDTFKGTESGSKGLLPKTSTLGLYITNFYSWFTTKDFSSLDFSTKNKENKDGIQKLISQEIGYNNQKNLARKDKDTNMLLSTPIEFENNNIDPSYLNLSTSKGDVPATPYGSMDASSPVASNTPNIEDLIGPNSYADEAEQNKAKLFLSYILKSMAPPKNFYIPSKSEAKDNKVTIYLPYANADIPYTTVDISTKTDSSGNNEYDQMVEYLNKDTKYYQPYKLKTRITNVLRTIYLESLFRPYQERTKDFKNKEDKSLIEKEKEAAFAGLDKKYYDDLKSKSVADVNLETLRAINTLAYFVYKIHQDNERTALVTAAIGMQSNMQDMQDTTTYIKPIGSYIENRCWSATKDSSSKIKQACGQ